MLVARALPVPKIPRRERHRIYAHDHLGATLAWSLDAVGATFSQCLVFPDALATLIISRSSEGKPSAGERNVDRV